MSSFQGSDPIYVVSETRNVTYRFNIETKSSYIAREGWLAYGTTVSGVSVTAYKEADADNRSLPGGDLEVSDLVQGVPTLNENNIDVRMSYPETNGVGYYRLDFEITASDGSIDGITFDPVIVKTI